MLVPQPSLLRKSRLCGADRTSAAPAEQKKHTEQGAQAFPSLPGAGRSSGLFAAAVRDDPRAGRDACRHGGDVQRENLPVPSDHRAKALYAPASRWYNAVMLEEMRRISLHPRLLAAAELLGKQRVIADIGCDHGRLSCALLQRGACDRCIAADVSAPSLEKAKRLSGFVGVADRIDLRCGDGLSVLQCGEADAVAMLGMGGTLMARLLDACEQPLMGARLLVLQPMRAEEDIRRYLYEHGYRIRDDRVVRDAGRLYQVFSVLPPCAGERDDWPVGFPAGCFQVGYRAFARREALLPLLVKRNLEQCLLRLQTARGTNGEARLAQRAADMQTILKHWRDGSCC